MFVYKSEYVFISLLDICILMTMARFKQPLFLKKRPMFLKKHWTFSKIPRDVFFKTTVCFFEGSSSDIYELTTRCSFHLCDALHPFHTKPLMELEGKRRMLIP